MGQVTPGAWGSACVGSPSLDSGLPPRGFGWPRAPDSRAPRACAVCFCRCNNSIDHCWPRAAAGARAREMDRAGAPPTRRCGSTGRIRSLGYEVSVLGVLGEVFSLEMATTRAPLQVHLCGSTKTARVRTAWEGCTARLREGETTATRASRGSLNCSTSRFGFARVASCSLLSLSSGGALVLLAHVSWAQPQENPGQAGAAAQ